MGRIRFGSILAWIALASFLLPLASACAPQQEAAKAPAAKTRVVVATGVDTQTLSPFYRVIITPDKQLIEHMFDPLVRFGEPGKLEPYLAESWKNLDDRTWQFKLRQGVKFHNGEPFDAESVKATFDTELDPNTKSPITRLFEWIDRVEVVDQYTVNFKSKVPTFTVGNALTDLGIVPAKYLKEKGLEYFGQHPVGTGPFKFVEWVKDDHVTLTANKEYWKGAPKIETLIWRPIKEASARVAALIAGEVDIAVNVPPEMVPDIEKSGRAVAKSTPSVRVFLVGMSNLDKSLPTANKLVRQALNYGIDRESLNKNIMGGYGKPVATWLIPGTFGYNPDLKPIPYDPKKAKELLAQAGYPNGFSVVLDSPDGRYPKDKEMAQAIAGQLAQIGVKVEVKTYEWGVFTKSVWDHKANPLVLFAWGDHYDPEALLVFTLKTGGIWSQYTSPALDSLIVQAQSTLDAEKRKKVILQIQDVLMDESPYMYIAQLGDIYGVAKGVDWSPRPDEAMWLFGSTLK